MGCADGRDGSHEVVKLVEVDAEYARTAESVGLKVTCGDPATNCFEGDVEMLSGVGHGDESFGLRNGHRDFLPETRTPERGVTYRR
jgi:hypothetical protein